MKLWHWYHVYADGNWYEPVAEHCRALKISGLYEKLDGWFVGFVGTEENVAVARAALDEHVPGYEVCGWELTGWEQVTLEPLWRHSLDHDGLVSYGHTKGASRHDPIDVPWRRDMTYHCFINWHRPVNALIEDGFAIAGAHWFTGGPSSRDGYGHGGMFGGNFWWTHNELLRQGGPPDNLTRHHAEHWLGQLCEVTPLTSETIYDLNTGPLGTGWPAWT